MAGSSSRKGRLVELVAAKLYATPGVKLEVRAMLPPRIGKGRKREIDILISFQVAGCLFKIAIECKNENKSIEAPYIDAFVGKLQYVGIPSQHGIFITATRYTIGAQQRAKEAGIKLLTLTGLSEDRLSAAIFEAFQSIVYLLLRVKSVSLENTSSTPPLAAFVDEAGELCGTIFDPIWMMWVNGFLPVEIGEHTIEVELPGGWGQEIDGKYELVRSLSADVQITGLILTYRGQLTEHALIDASENSTEKWRLEARFDTPELPVTFTQVFSEDELEQYVNKLPGFRMVTGRFLLPRIDAFTRFGYMFWPPSEKSAAKLQQFAEVLAAGEEIDPGMFGGVPIDERTMDAVLDPIWSGYVISAQSQCQESD